MQGYWYRRSEGHGHAPRPRAPKPVLSSIPWGELGRIRSLVFPFSQDWLAQPLKSTLDRENPLGRPKALEFQSA